jgi:catechol 2,3-dioxygenase-like lactoylglutathione lyase family enzyme
MIRGLNHVGISVRDLARSIKFYSDVLEMQVVEGPISFGGSLYEQILALKGVRGEAVLLKRQGLQLELFEFTHPKPNFKDARYPVSDHGLSHFCIEISDIDSVYRRMLDAGVVFHCPPMNFFGEALATYARDPDGNVFELLELTKARHLETR